MESSILKCCSLEMARPTGRGDHRHTIAVVTSTRPAHKTERSKRGSAWEKELIKDKSRKTGHGGYETIHSSIMCEIAKGIKW